MLSIMSKILGLVLLVVGIGLAVWGYQMSDSLTARLSRSLIRSQSNEVMFRYIGGAVSAAVGFFLLARK
jgi:uncharacterized BrkB/YihY/UPF0761 family membrane protein